MHRDAKFPNTFATVSRVSGLQTDVLMGSSRVPFPVGGGGGGKGETRDESKPCISDSISGSRLFDCSPKNATAAFDVYLSMYASGRRDFLPYCPEAGKPFKSLQFVVFSCKNDKNNILGKKMFILILYARIHRKIIR